MKRTTFTVPAIPIAQPRQRVAVRGKFATNYTPAKHPVNDFKATVRHSFAAVSDAAPTENAVYLQVLFYFPRPKGKCWKTKPMPRYLHTKKPDLDNVIKSLKDALTGLAWKDDSQVARLSASKHVCSGDEQPHVEVMIQELG